MLRNENHLHFWTILFQQKTFNSTIYMRTNNQLHYYSTMPKEVTFLIAVRQTLLCFHLTLRENNRSLAWFFRKEILSPNFHRKLDYRTRDRLYFFRSYFHNPPLADINLATYETFWVQLRGRTTVYMHM